MAVLFLILFGMAQGPPPPLPGAISGSVFNASRGGAPVPAAEVVLRVSIDGQFVAVETTRTNAQGRFAFVQLPVGIDTVYLAGANWGGVHFPGSRVSLTDEHPRADVRIGVFEPLEQPSPLVIRRMDVSIEAEAGSLVVTEALRIDNPSQQCFVGTPRHTGGGPVTLELHIPADFKRITFDKEAFGRRFAVINGKLVTGIPWPPGERELRYTYIVPDHGRERIWERPLDLACDRVTIAVASDQGVRSNLTQTAGNRAPATFASEAGLPAGQVVRIELEVRAAEPIVWVRYGALGLFSLSLAVTVVVLWRRRTSNRASARQAHAETRGRKAA